MEKQRIKECELRRKSKHAFTLVELIIVITILAILATIGFITMGKYFSSSRDSVRLTDMKSIYEAINVYTVRTGSTPYPDSDKIEVKNGGAILTYQGYAGDGVFRLIQLNNGGLDPKDKKNYVYTTDSVRRKAQLMGYLETTENVRVLGGLFSQSYAEDDSRYIYVYGDTLGVLTDGNKVPLQDVIAGSGVNLLDSAQVPAGTTAYFGGSLFDNGKSTSTGSTLVSELTTAQSIASTPSGSGCVLGTTFVLGSCSL